MNPVATTRTIQGELPPIEWEPVSVWEPIPQPCFVREGNGPDLIFAYTRACEAMGVRSVFNEALT